MTSWLSDNILFMRNITGALDCDLFNIQLCDDLHNEWRTEDIPKSDLPYDLRDFLVCFLFN